MQAQSWGGRKFLLVSHAESSRSADHAAVLAAGGDCVVVSSAAEAALRLDEVRPSLVLMDDQTAWDDDGEGYAQLAARLSTGIQRPLVLLTSQDPPAELIERCWQAGLEDCIPRPLEPEQLSERLAALDQDLPRALLPSSRRAPRTVVLAGGHGGFREQLGDLLQHCGYHVLNVAEGAPIDPTLFEHTGKVNLLLLSVDPSRPEAMPSMNEVRARISDGAEKIMVLFDRNLVGWPETAALDTRAPLDALVQRIDRELQRPTQFLRASERVPFFCPVEFREAGRDPQLPWRSGFSFSVSSGGVFIKTLVPFHAGAALELKIRLTTTREEFTLTGVVAWSNPFASRRGFSWPAGMGVEFLGVPLSRRLAQLIELCRDDRLAG